MFGKIRNLLFGSVASGSLAKSRLHFVLVQDRTGLSSDEMVSFKREMLTVLEKYFVIDEEGFDIAYAREGEQTTLRINSPVLVRRALIGHDKQQPQAKGNNNKKAGNASGGQGK